MVQTLRTLYRRQQGRMRKNINWAIDPPITFRSVVLMSAGEARMPAFEGIEDIEPHLAFNLGDADIWVTNVSPHDGGVEFILHVNWPSPLPVIVDLAVLGPRDQFFYPTI